MKTLRKIGYERLRYDGTSFFNTEYLFASSKKDAKKKLLDKHPDAFMRGHIDLGIEPVSRTLKDINSSIEENQRADYKEHKLWKADSGFWGNYCVFADPITEVDRYTEDNVYEYTKHWTEGKPYKADYNNVKKMMAKEFPDVEYRIGVRSTYYTPRFDPEPTGVDSVEWVEIVKKDLELA